MVHWSVRESECNGLDVTMVQLNIIVLAALCSFAVATTVEQCPGKSFEDLSDRVELTLCKSLPCKLKKGTTQHIIITFTPEKDFADVKNHITADVLGVPFPFVGVDGNSVCDKLTTKDGQKASCPLKAGTEICALHPTWDGVLDFGA
ncbi:ML domain-containing protein [Phthorimaea operculella]|nr:ML domain-containing protein [Phthorimaea operculella]